MRHNCCSAFGQIVLIISCQTEVRCISQSQRIPLGCDGVRGCYEIHCIKNTWSGSEMWPAMRDSVIAQALPNPTKMFGNLSLRAYVQI